MSTPSEIAGIVIVGGGVIGTAIAAEVSQTFDDVFLIEARNRLGLGSSTRNSGVIHAGIYYEPGSLKAFHCVRGLEMLYEFCCAHEIPHSKTGKLIVGEDLAELNFLKQRGDENGVEGLQIVESDFIRKLEPNVAGSYALYSPQTGIIDAEALLRVLEELATANGAHIVPGTPLLSAEVKDDFVHLGTPRETVKARIVVNAAGLFADEVAALFGFDEYTIYPCRGEYAEVVPSRRGLINGLVYPLPLRSGHGLGVHFTRTTTGALLVGPNSRYVDSKDDYENDRLDVDYFYEAGRAMVPALRLEDLRLSYSGLRSRLRSVNEHSFADFVIEPDPVHDRVIHLIGMESPGLTSCLSIAKSVGEMIRGM